MEQYTEKSALVAKIEKLREDEIKWMDRQGFTDYHMGTRDAYTKILESLYQDPKKLREK